MHDVRRGHSPRSCGLARSCVARLAGSAAVLRLLYCSRSGSMCATPPHLGHGLPVSHAPPCARRIQESDVFTGRARPGRPQLVATDVAQHAVGGDDGGDQDDLEVVQVELARRHPPLYRKAALGRHGPADRIGTGNVHAHVLRVWLPADTDQGQTSSQLIDDRGRRELATPLITDEKHACAAQLGVMAVTGSEGLSDQRCNC
jgi:hypothetical protein